MSLQRRETDPWMTESLKFGGVVPMILQMSQQSTQFYKGQTTWLFVTFLYVSIVYIAEIPWFSRKKDFQCHGNISKACLVECYEEHFTRPVIGVWNSFGLVVYTIFFMMEFSVFQNLQNTKFPEGETSSNIVYNEDDKKNEEMILYLSKEKFLLATFLVYYLVQIAIQGTVLIILWCHQRPLIIEDIWCHSVLCQGPYLCVFMGTQEKIMSLVLMTTLCVFIIIFCIIFFLYTIGIYALTSVVLTSTRSTKLQF